ncbi:hypothetical protein BDY21DRAFT_315235 [Lineolata rhizophorae]|uniref:S5 DRBM domain-containing protein n=1 Tax=Lineolata rhizophorae TaxID=578093 RepID=A0A6A6PBG6_9PEZI|nr:hypothetical protein BDY21DRAFT_315235 [Lineolata rhizophorae]
MSVSRPAARCRCLFSMPPSSVPKPHPRRTFTTTPPLNRRVRRGYKNIKAEDMGLINKAAAEYRPYSEEEKALLSKKYNKEQMDAIEAAEAEAATILGEGSESSSSSAITGIDPRDLATQAGFRRDYLRLGYVDDLSRISPVLDKRKSKEVPPNMKTNALPPSEEKLAEQLGEGLDSLLDRDPTVQAYFENNSEGRKVDPSTGKPTPETQVVDELIQSQIHQLERNNLYVDPEYSALAPDIPRVQDPRFVYESDEAETGEVDPDQQRVRRAIGMSEADASRFMQKVLVVRWVANQTRLGKVRSTSALAVAGSAQDGLLGIGSGKSVEPDQAMKQANANALRNVRPIPKYEGRTIYGDVQGKVSGTVVQLMHRPPGFGLRCQHLVFEMARAVGITDLAARVPRSRNKMNVVKATYQALMKQKLPEDVARGRGRKMVDVRKVYYAGRT